MLSHMIVIFIKVPNWVGIVPVNMFEERYLVSEK